jgi:hypothetical protein
MTMPIVRLPQGGELRDEIRQAIYDQIRLTSADALVGTRSFFSSVQGKPLSQSNLRQNNLLETAVSFRVQGMGFDAQNWDAANRSVLPYLMDNSSMSIRVGEKIYWRGTLAFLVGRLISMEAVALYGQAAPTVKENIYQHYGEPVAAPVQLTGKHVVDINPLQSFASDWTVDADNAIATPVIAAGTRLCFTFSFKGIMRRPVQ